MAGPWIAVVVRRYPINSQRIAGLVLAAFGVFWMVATTQQRFLVDLKPIPLSFVPFWSGAILVGLGALIALRSAEGGREPLPPLGVSEPAPADAPEHASEGIYNSKVRVALGIVATLVYAGILTQVHFLLTTFGLMAVGLALSGARVGWRLMASAAAISLILFIIFVLWLGVPLPGGQFG